MLLNVCLKKNTQLLPVCLLRVERDSFKSFRTISDIERLVINFATNHEFSVCVLVSSENTLICDIRLRYTKQ